MKNKKSVLQDWVQELSLMQQSVLIAAMRGADGVNKIHPSKYIARWFRRCIVISAFDKCVLTNPYDSRGGSYTGPSVDNLTSVAIEDNMWESAMDKRVKEYLNSIDELPHHYHLHMLHAIEIVGYKHPDVKIKSWWNKTYNRMAHDMHLSVETEEQLDNRLNDNRDDWVKDETRFKK